MSENYVQFLIVLGIAPFALYFTFKRPLIFPFCLYLIVVQFHSFPGATLMTAFAELALVVKIVMLRKFNAPPKSWYIWAAYIFLVVISLTWSIELAASLRWVSQMVPLFLFYTIVAIYPVERRDVRIIGGMIVFIGAVFSTIALVIFETSSHGPNERLIVKFGTPLDPNNLGSSLLLPIALAVGALLISKNIWLRLGALLASIPMIATLLLTGSRGALIALIVMLGYIGFKTRYRLQVFGFMALAGVASLFLPTVWERFNDKGLEGGSGRTEIWNVGMVAFQQHFYWLHGAGIGGFPTAYSQTLVEQGVHEHIFAGWSRPAHNFILSTAVDFGIFGVCLFVYAWYRTWTDARGNIVIEATIIGLISASWFLDVMGFQYIWLALTMAALVKNAAEPKRLGVSRQPQPALQTVIHRKFAWQTRQRTLQ